MASQTVTSRAVAATRTYSIKPTTPYAASSGAQLWLNATTGNAYVNFGLPRDLVEGKTVTSAVVRLAAFGVWPGSRTISVVRHAEPSASSYANMTWANQPAALGGAVAATETDPMVGSTYVYEFDVTNEMQAVANGSPYFGFRITTTDTTSRYFHGPTHPYAYPVLILTVVDATPAPDRVAPEGTVSIQKPTFVWDAPDDISQIQAQADAVGGTFAAPAWDSGQYASLLGQVDTNAKGWAGLAAAASADLRFRQLGPLGWSPWSDPVTITRQTQPTLTPTLPTPSGTTNDPTPPHTWTFTPQASFRLWVTDADGRVWYDSKQISGADQGWTPNLGNGLPDLSVMTSHLQVWDTRADRISSPGDPAYVETAWSWTIAPNSATAAVGTLTAAVTGTPAVQLAWARASGAPDEWIVKRGNVLVARFPGTTGQMTSTTWEWDDWAAPPNATSEYNVIAVVANVGSQRGPTATILNEVTGVWLYDPTTGANFAVRGADAANGVEYAESSIIYTPVFSEVAIKRALTLRGLEGSVGGLLDDRAGRTIDQQMVDLTYIRANATDVYRLIFGAHNVPVLVSGLSAVTSEVALRGRLMRRVSFLVQQVGEFESVIS